MEIFLLLHGGGKYHVKIFMATVFPCSRIALSLMRQGWRNGESLGLKGFPWGLQFSCVTINQYFIWFDLILSSQEH